MGASADKEQTRYELLEAAGQLFAEHGYDGTSTRAIAEKAQVNLGGIHYHFGGKEQLYVETFRHACRDEQDSSEQEGLLADFLAKTTTRRPVDIAKLIHKMVSVDFRDFLEPNDEDWRVRLLMRELYQPSSAMSELIQQVFKPKHTRWMQVYRIVKPEASEETIHQWAFLVGSTIVFYLSSTPWVCQLLGRESLDAPFFDNVTAMISRCLIQLLDLPLPKELR